MRTLLDVINTDNEPNTLQDLIDKQKTKVYISGKISDLPYREAYAAFERAESIVSSMGNCVAVNPMKFRRLFLAPLKKLHRLELVNQKHFYIPI